MVKKEANHGRNRLARWKSPHRRMIKRRAKPIMESVSATAEDVLWSDIELFV